MHYQITVHAKKQQIKIYQTQQYMTRVIFLQTIQPKTKNMQIVNKYKFKICIIDTFANKFG